MRNYDALALDALLDASPAKRQARLARLSKEASRDMGDSCPCCEGTDVESNGATGSERTYLCTSCGHQWSPR